MKTKAILLFTVLLAASATAQISQDSINRLQEEVNRKQRDINAMQKALNHSQHDKNAMKETQGRRSDDTQDVLVQEILNDLLSMNIIRNKEEVAFSLTFDRMDVNNKRQSDAVLEKFRSKYHVTKGQAIAHARTRNSSSTSVTSSTSN